MRPNPVTEATAMRVVMEHERAQGRQVFDVSEKNLGYDITSVDLASGDLRLIEVKGIGDTDGSVLLTPGRETGTQLGSITTMCPRFQSL